MKIKLLVLIALIVSVVSQAQTTQPTAKVASAFTQEELSGKTDMDIRYMNFVADKGFVMHQGGKEGAFYPNLSSVLKVQFAGIPVNTLTTETFNPFMVNSSRDTHQFFKIDGTDMVIQIYSDSYATTIFSDFLINERNKAHK